MAETPEVYCPGCDNSTNLATVENEHGWHAECGTCGSKIEEIGAWNRWINGDFDNWIFIPLLVETQADHALIPPDKSIWHWR